MQTWLRSVGVGAVAVLCLVAFPVTAGAKNTSPNKGKNAQTCKQGGWADLGFANAGQCTSTVTATAKLYPEARALCGSYGGTFEIIEDVYTRWICWQYDQAGGAFAARSAALHEQCFADGGAFTQLYFNATRGDTYCQLASDSMS